MYGAATSFMIFFYILIYYRYINIDLKRKVSNNNLYFYFEQKKKKLHK